MKHLCWSCRLWYLWQSLLLFVGVYTLGLYALGSLDLTAGVFGAWCIALHRGAYRDLRGRSDA